MSKKIFKTIAFRDKNLFKAITLERMDNNFKTNEEAIRRIFALHKKRGR